MMTSGKINVKVSFPFPGLDLSRQLSNRSGCLGDFTFHVNPVQENEVYDFWIVYENIARPVEHTQLKNAGHTIYITGEPPTVKTYSTAFLRQFHLVVSSHSKIRHPNLLLRQQALPWMVEKTYAELQEIQDIPKTKFMSIIASNKALTDGHKKRLEFARNLKALYPDKIDLFGRGIYDFADKWDVLAPYKYHLCIENASLPHYFTEKLVDSFLSLSFPLYYGCQNIADYFSPASFLTIDINDVEASRQTIEMLMRNDNHYCDSLKHLKDARKDCLDKYNLFPFLKNVIENNFGGLRNSHLRHKVVSKKVLQSAPDIVKYYIKRYFMQNA
jgi:hypothetical protein